LVLDLGVLVLVLGFAAAASLLGLDVNLHAKQSTIRPQSDKGPF
jgi:hypothetical protein